MQGNHDTHRKVMGYFIWIFGFTGSHRFYYGKPISGTKPRGIEVLDFACFIFTTRLSRPAGSRSSVTRDTEHTEKRRFSLAPDRRFSQRGRGGQVKNPCAAAPLVLTVRRAWLFFISVLSTEMKK